MLHKKRLIFVTLIIMILALPVTVLAGTRTVAGITLTYPDPYVSCTPSDKISVSGVTEPIEIIFYVRDPITTHLVSLGLVTTSSDGEFPFPYPSPIDSEMEFAVLVRIISTNTKLGGKWTVTCTPPPEFEGCTPGYWKNHIDSWVGYSPGDDFETVFGVDASFDPDTLLDALNLGGGGEYALARHAVGALLNSTNPEVDYPYTTAEVIAMVQEAYSTGKFEDIKDEFESANEAFCPLD